MMVLAKAWPGPALSAWGPAKRRGRIREDRVRGVLVAGVEMAECLVYGIYLGVKDRFVIAEVEASLHPVRLLAYRVAGGLRVWSCPGRWRVGIPPPHRRHPYSSIV